MEKRLEFKGAMWLRNNTSGSNINPRVRQRRRRGTTICGWTGGSIEKNRRKKSN
jgi:hypothetical protein